MSINDQVYQNKVTKLLTTIFGVTLAISSIHHGFFEFLQGNAAPKGILIQAIGEKQRFWEHGTEEAITIIPNYMISGFLAMAIGVFIIMWSCRYLDRKNGSTVFLLSFIVATLFGGGIFHVVFFLPVWAYSTRIHKRLNFWSKLFSNKVGCFIGKLWPVFAGIAAVSFIIALEMSIFGIVPGVEDADKKLYTIWSILVVPILTIQLSYFSGFAFDINKRLETTKKIKSSAANQCDI